MFLFKIQSMIQTITVHQILHNNDICRPPLHGKGNKKNSFKYVISREEQRASELIVVKITRNLFVLLNHRNH